MDPSASELQSRLCPRRHPATVLPHCLSGTRIAAAKFYSVSCWLPLGAEPVPKYVLSTVAAGPGCSVLPLSVFTHLWFPLPVSLPLDAGGAISSSISRGAGPEMKPARLCWQELCVGCYLLLQLIVL